MTLEEVTLPPGGAPDTETAELMQRLSDLQQWCFLMTQKDSGGIAAGRLVQDVRVFIVERLYPRAALSSIGGE
jgi:hypothetical protein